MNVIELFSKAEGKGKRKRPARARLDVLRLARNHANVSTCFVVRSQFHHL